MTAATDFKLATYPLPEVLPPSEKTLKLWMNLSFGALAIGLLPGFVCVGALLGAVIVSVYDGRLYPAFLHMLALVCVIAIVAAILISVGDDCSKRLDYFYTVVQQGKVLKLDTREGGKLPIQWGLLVYGYNRMNEPREYFVVIDAGKWKNGAYKEGDYVDFRKTSTD